MSIFESSYVRIVMSKTTAEEEEEEEEAKLSRYSIIQIK